MKSRTTTKLSILLTIFMTTPAFAADQAGDDGQGMSKGGSNSSNYRQSGSSSTGGQEGTELQSNQQGQMNKEKNSYQKRNQSFGSNYSKRKGKTTPNF